MNLDTQTVLIVVIIVLGSIAVIGAYFAFLAGNKRAEDALKMADKFSDHTIAQAQAWVEVRKAEAAKTDTPLDDILYNATDTVLDAAEAIIKRVRADRDTVTVTPPPEDGATDVTKPVI